MGIILVYTGDGKGKTTAAIGLAIRALGHNQKVCIIQFLKSKEIKTGEYEFFKNNNVEIYPTGTGFSWKGNPNEHRIALKKAWSLAIEKIKSDSYDLIILDEINNVLDISNFKVDDIISVDEIINCIKNKPKRLNIILTGRNANYKIIEIADLVTEMKFIKHPYEKGVTAIAGIEY